MTKLAPRRKLSKTELAKFWRKFWLDASVALKRRIAEAFQSDNIVGQPLVKVLIDSVILRVFFCSAFDGVMVDC